MYEIDNTKAYRLVDVRDHEGNSKVETQELYMARVGCVSKSIQLGIPWNGRSCMYMEFIQDREGNWINLRLRTSLVDDIQEKDGVVEIRTQNSIYVLEPAELREPEYLDEAEVIELYLSTDAQFKFCTGFYYNAEKEPLELVCHAHAGTFQDSCLICLKSFPYDTACRYFPSRYSIEFYNTLYRQQDYSRRLLIHNVGKDYLTVSFEGFNAEWRIAPGDQRWITPYNKTGADDTFEEEES